MAKAIDEHRITPLFFQRFTDEFAKPDWAKPLDNPFGLTNIIQALLDEAGAKGMGVIIQASLVPLEYFYGPAAPETAADTQPTGENPDDHATEHPG